MIPAWSMLLYYRGALPRARMRTAGRGQMLAYGWGMSSLCGTGRGNKGMGLGRRMNRVQAVPMERT